MVDGVHVPAAPAHLHLWWRGLGGKVDEEAGWGDGRGNRAEPARQECEVEGVAKSGGVKMRGRALIALGLVGFVLVAMGVIWRRSVGVQQAGAIKALEQQRTDLEARRAALEADIRDATSRTRLARIAEDRLGMRVPSDTQVITLPRPSAPSPRRETPE